MSVRRGRNDRPRDLRGVIVASLILLVAIVALGILRPPAGRDAVTEVGANQAPEAEDIEAANFPLRSEPRRDLRRGDDRLEPSVGPEDGAEITL